MAKEQNINLTDTNGATPLMVIGGSATKAVIDIVATTWGSSVVDLQWSVYSDEDANWNDFSPAVQFSSSATAKRNIGVAGVWYLRLKTSTSDVTGDTDAKVYMRAS